MAENKIFAEMQKKLDKPSCFGKYGDPGKKVCGMCWFANICKKPKKTVKSQKKEDSTKDLFEEKTK